MGPMSVARSHRTKGRTTYQRHIDCRHGKNCKGPGCVINSGKTAKKRS